MKVPVVFKLGETTGKVTTSNMGGGGMRLTNSTLPSGAELDIRFRTAKHRAYIQAKARVVYTLPDQGSGLEFLEMEPENRQQILRAVHGKSGERRKAPRIPLATQIHIQDSMALAYSRDLSVGGIFVETKEAGKIGTRVDLRFNLNDDGPVVIATGIVRYLVPKLGMGIQFTELTAADRKRIQEHVDSSPNILPEPVMEDDET